MGFLHWIVLAAVNSAPVAARPALGPGSIHEEVLFRGEPLAPQPMPGRGSENLAQTVYRARAAAVVAVMAPDGQGTGTLIREDGYILTCAHVVSDSLLVQVNLQGGQTFEAIVLGRDPLADLALLKITSKEPLPWIALSDLDDLEVGDPVVAIGHPKGFGWTVNEGIVSNLFMFRDGKRDPGIIQTQVPLNPGNSGGPLLDSDGRLVGVVAQGDPGAQAMNWCISARAVRQFLFAHSKELPASTLAIQATPAGAKIFVDGSEVGTAPHAVALVGAGPHVVEVRKDGFGDVAAPVVVLQRARADLTVRLTPAGTLAVTTDVPDVQIYVDGVLRGTAPIAIDIASGHHTVSGVKRGTRNTAATAVVSRARETEIALSHPQSVAFLSVESLPAGAEVIVDGESVGVTPISEHAVPPGRHVVDVKRDGGRPRRVVVDLNADGRRTIDFDLQDELSALAPVSAVPHPAAALPRKSVKRSRIGYQMMLGGIGIAAVSAGILTSRPRDPDLRAAAAASLVAGSTSFVIGPALILRDRPGSSVRRADSSAGIGATFAF